MFTCNADVGGSVSQGGTDREPAEAVEEQHSRAADANAEDSDGDT